MDIKYLLKNNQLFRGIIKPYMDLKRKTELKKYANSQDAKKLKYLKDRHQGERCFIIGNGPSLKQEDLDLLQTEITFGMNRIYEIYPQTQWRPTYYMAVDNDFLLGNKKELNNIGAQIEFLAIDINVPIDDISANVIRILEHTDFKLNKWNDRSSHISEDVSQYFSVGYTVTFTAIQLAIYMGIKEIYLLGVDFNYSVVRDEKGKVHKDTTVKDYFSGQKYASTVLNYNSVLYAYQKAKEYADTHNIKIYNATRGGKLEVFERKSIDSVFKDCSKKK